ncbi:MAG: FAD-binding oxidoreductase [Flavobacterium sp.]|uniref:PepSY domain-containing protein n=1 Tax=Flavobacterium sp. TaxID=239 RepID=UPI001200E25B|nr:PepSY domain-containing protein [Flavobacterium sp.]RZJ68532.1 MAG: FAD-binding oxidoreductase [Flavobacterium sp.]
MTISIWRYSHLTLAVSSFLFIALACLTGIILAFEPVSDSLKPYAINGMNDVSLATTISSAQKNYDEIIEINIGDRFVSADVINQEGDSEQIYIDPKTGKSLGKLEPENEFFQTVTTLHRSLFLHGLGRVFMAITAFLLFLIAITGSILVVKRQRGLKRFFSKIVREDFFSFYHVFLGRIWLLPILIISLTGTFLSLEHFKLFPENKVKHDVDFENIKQSPKKAIADFDVFKNIRLSEVKSIEFPFSPEPEDAFTVKLHNREIVVNQITGEILSEKKYPAAADWISLSMDLHTGRASIVWAIVLAIACVNILFFIYSGFAMTLKRRAGKIKNKFKKDEAEFIVLAGSENGSTMRFAKTFHQSLLRAGKKSYFSELNSYSEFVSASQIIVFAATYGRGDAPSNATKAIRLISEIPQNKNVRFSIVGFGSHAYPDFCQFAFDLHNAMSQQAHLEPLLEIKTINDKSVSEFAEWVNEFSRKTGVPLDIDHNQLSAKPKKLQTFTVTTKTDAAIDGTFTIKLRPKKKKPFESGDLLNVYPMDDHRERQYSIGKISGEIQLSVKRHENGLGSDYLHSLIVGQTIKARLVENPEFHYPSDAKQTILISNGTGIAPFLGMIEQNGPKTKCHLYCGFRNGASFEPYRELLESQYSSGKLHKLNVAYSREGDKRYVKDLLAIDSQLVASVLKENGTIMICGSLAMQENVLELLASICKSLEHPLSHYQAVGKIRMDCY